MTKAKEKYHFNIYAYMSNVLMLSGSELIVFALIHSFSRGVEGLYFGSQKRLAEYCTVSVSTVKRCLTKLIKKGYIKKCMHSERVGYRSMINSNNVESIIFEKKLPRGFEPIEEHTARGEEKTSAADDVCIDSPDTIADENYSVEDYLSEKLRGAGGAKSADEDYSVEDYLSEKLRGAGGAKSADEDYSAPDYLSEKLRGAGGARENKRKEKSAKSTKPKAESKEYKPVDYAGNVCDDHYYDFFVDDDDDSKYVEYYYYLDGDQSEENDDQPCTDVPALLEKLRSEGIPKFKLGVRKPKFIFRDYGPHGIVQMTREQYQSLRNMVDDIRLTEYVRKLENLIKDEGYRTFNPYKTIRRWILEDSEL